MGRRIARHLKRYAGWKCSDLAVIYNVFAFYPSGFALLARLPEEKKFKHK